MSNNKELEDFLADEEFRLWVLNPTPSINIFWEKWLEANPQYKQKAFQARELILSFKYPRNTHTKDEEKEEILKSILRVSKNIDSYDAKKPSWTPTRIAASITFLLGLSLMVYFLVWEKREPVVEDHVIETIMKHNPKGRKSEISLADGTKIFLNSNSTLTYYSNYAENRFIELDGEAYFEVAKDPDHPFVVKSGKVEARALGTAFNVKSYNKTVDVFLAEGSVQVSVIDQDDQVQILEPMQKSAYIANKGLTKSFQTDLSDVMWTQGVIHFNEAPLTEVLRTLENWYGVKIKVSGEYKNYKYSGEFNNEYLSNVLQSMSKALEMSYELNGKNVEIKFNSL